MRSPEELKALFEFAQSQGLPWIEVDGVKMPVPVKREAPPSDAESPQIMVDPCSEYTDEEILYWSTPRFEELLAQRLEKEKHAKEEAEFRKTT